MGDVRGFRFTDWTGTRFSRLMVTRRIASHGKATWYECLCDCGKTTKLSGSNLLSGKTRSCGCLKKEELKSRGLDPHKLRINEIGRYYRANARRRGIVWSLSMPELEKLVMNPCTYCGDASVPIGIDRKVSSLGYIYKNCSPCCKWCNISKSNRTVREFKAWVRRVYERDVRR